MALPSEQHYSKAFSISRCFTLYRSPLNSSTNWWLTAQVSYVPHDRANLAKSFALAFRISLVNLT